MDGSKAMHRIPNSVQQFRVEANCFDFSCTRLSQPNNNPLTRYFVSSGAFSRHNAAAIAIGITLWK